MAYYIFDERSVTGYGEIDSAHARIAELSQEMLEAYRSDAGFDDVYALFRELKKNILAHFEIEEDLIARLPNSAEVSDHLARHKADHDFFRSSFEYADDKFKANRASGKIPNVIEMIPEKYFEELKDLDAEMGGLFDRYGCVSH